MARTIQIDRLQMQQIRLVKGEAGELLVECEFNLMSGDTVVQSKMLNAGSVLGVARKAALRSVFDEIVSDVMSSELG